MMRRITGYIGLALALLVPAAAKTQVFDQRSIPLAVAWDVNGATSDPNRIVESTPITDSYTHVITAQPDTCREIDLTVTDSTPIVSAGIFTVVGTDCYGDPLTATFDISSSSGTGNKTLVVGTASTAASANLASGPYFASITSVTSGVMTGEDGIAVVVFGYSTNVAGAFYQYPAYGQLRYNRQAAPFRSITLGQWKKSISNTVITASGTTWTATNAGFTDMAVGDLIRVNVNGNIFTTRVTTFTSTTSIVVADTILFPTAGIKGHEWLEFHVSSDPQDGWFRVDGWETAHVIFDVDALTASTGIDSKIECVPGDVDEDAAIQIDTDTVLTTATGNAVTPIDFRVSPAYSRCRIGVNFDSADSIGGDTAGTDDINLYLGLRR